MFNISGPPVIQPIQHPTDSGLVLRLNQRLTAEVLQVSGVNVVLSIDGVRVVARLTSEDQAAALQDRRVAQFIVRDLTSNQLVFQLAPQAGQSQAIPAASPDLARALLAQLGLPATEANLTAMGAMLARGLPAETPVLSQLQSVLNQLGAWGASEASTAAGLLAAGLPLTSGTLNLALNASPETIQAFTRLLSLLQGISPRRLTGKGTEALQNALSEMLMASPEWSSSPESMLEGLKKAITMLGRSVESALAEEAQPTQGKNATLASAQSKGLLALLALRREVASNGPRELTEAIDRFLDALRLQQFKSSDVEPAPGRSEWLQLNLPLQMPPPPGSAQHPAFHQASLRIAYKREGDERRVDPAFTRLLIAVDLEGGQQLEVDLSVVQHKIGMQVTASLEELCNLAKEELSSFTQGLRELGYDLQTSRFEVGQAGERMELTGPEIRPLKYLAIDLEV
jgi:hypothetical protein